MTGPLEGLRILDLTRLLPGGYATLLMADLGADVIKIEEPGRGDYIRWTPPLVGDDSTGHLALNRNKRSVTLNLKSERGKELFLDLCADADVVIESFRPGVMDRLGVGYSVLSERNPKLIYCAISGYGQDGPRSQVAGHDLNYVGYAGLLSITGEDKPEIPGVQVGDLGGGAMSAVIAILAAVHRRASTGRGDMCDVAMMDGVVSWLSIHAMEFFATGVAPRGGGMHLNGVYPCYRIYPASDGWLTVGALEPQFWIALCNAIERPDLLNDGFAMGDRRAEVIAELEALFSTKTRDQWLKTFEGLDVCVGPVNDFEEAFEDEQVLARKMVAAVGDMRQVGNPIVLKDSPGDTARLPAPGLGEHTDEILAEVGIGSAELDDLKAAGAI